MNDYMPTLQEIQETREAGLLRYQQLVFENKAPSPVECFIKLTVAEMTARKLVAVIQVLKGEV